MTCEICGANTWVDSNGHGAHVKRCCNSNCKNADPITKALKQKNELLELLEQACETCWYFQGGNKSNLNSWEECKPACRVGKYLKNIYLKSKEEDNNE